jgi:phytoene dehydrogenase-like protein
MQRHDFDVVIVGSGINSLVCAALAAKRGAAVCVLERNAQLGGCIRTEALTLPGYLHDTLSGFHPLFVTSPAYPVLRQDLADAGLVYCNNRTPTGVLTGDGAHAILTTSREANRAAFDALSPGDGAVFVEEMQALESAAALTFGLLTGEPWSLGTLRLLGSELWKRGPRELLRFCGESLLTARGWLESRFSGRALRALLAPWVLHTGVGPDAVMSGFMNRLIAFTLESAGMPIVAGGSFRLVTAFKETIERHGGVLRVSSRVERIVVHKGRARGVRLSDGTEMRARRAVICNVTPTQLYLQLLGEGEVPARTRQAASRFRYGRSDMQIHIALSEPPRWRVPALADVTMVHLTDGIDAVAQAVGEAERGLLPRFPTIVVGQPTVSDPSRAPAGAAILWIQLQELPARVRADAAGVIAIPEEGAWSSALKEAYADRVMTRLPRISSA